MEAPGAEHAFHGTRFTLGAGSNIMIPTVKDYFGCGTATVLLQKEPEPLKVEDVRQIVLFETVIEKTIIPDFLKTFR